MKIIFLSFILLSASISIVNAMDDTAIQNSVEHQVSLATRLIAQMSSPPTLEEVKEIEKKTWEQHNALLAEPDKKIFIAAIYPLVRKMRADRDIADNFSPELTREEGILFGTILLNQFDRPQTHPDQWEISIFIRNGIKANAEIIGQAYVPKVDNAGDINVVILPTSIDSLGVFYRAAQGQGEEHNALFWLEVKKRLDAKTIRFLRLLDWQKAHLIK